MRHSFAEYLEFEESQSARHEYLDGEIFAMAGGSPEHSALSASVATQLANQARGGPCRVHASDLRIRVLATGLATYPDVSVIRGPWERDPESARTVVNPAIVIEVLSPSTAASDRGEKLEHYRRIPSLRAIALVASDRRDVEVWSRETSDAAWTRAIFGDGQGAPLGPTGFQLDVRALYDEAAEPAGQAP